jgi:hypothetical protein
MEFKANAPLVIHKAGNETLIERVHGDRFLLGDRLDDPHWWSTVREAGGCGGRN